MTGDRGLSATAHVVLGLVSIRPTTGHELAGFAERSIGNFFPLTRSRVYPELDRLCRLGLLDAIGAFATSKIVFLKEVGVGTAAAVLIDAFIVRALLVPSVMALLGPWNWWAPEPLRNLHQRLALTESLNASTGN